MENVRCRPPVQCLKGTSACERWTSVRHTTEPSRDEHANYLKTAPSCPPLCDVRCSGNQHVRSHSERIRAKTELIPIAFVPGVQTGTKLPQSRCIGTTISVRISYEYC